VTVQYAVSRRGIPSAASLRGWAQSALAGRRRRDSELLIRVVGAAESARLNATYRGKPGATNVLSFPFEAPRGLHSAALGDVVICAPVVRREAREQGKWIRAHWAHMVVHGALHLLGYDHREEGEAHRMESVERRVLARMGFADPYEAQ
jgi:probable rRNA maturation factor